MRTRYLLAFCFIGALNVHSTEQANYLIFNIQDQFIYKLVVDDTLKQALETQSLSCIVNSTKGMLGANISYSKEARFYELNLALEQGDANREPAYSAKQLFSDFSNVGLFIEDSLSKAFASITAPNFSIVRDDISHIPNLPLHPANRKAASNEIASCELY